VAVANKRRRLFQDIGLPFPHTPLRILRSGSPIHPPSNRSAVAKLEVVPPKLTTEANHRLSQSTDVFPVKTVTVFFAFSKVLGFCSLICRCVGDDRTWSQPDGAVIWLAVNQSLTATPKLNARSSNKIMRKKKIMEKKILESSPMIRSGYRLNEPDTI
jgi:hypothetical protein